MKRSIILFMLILPVILFGQDKRDNKFEIEANLGKVFPRQGEYLRDNWNGKFFSSINLIKNSKIVDYTIGLDYDLLSIADDRLKIMSPKIGVRKPFNFSNFILSPSINLGYSFINYTIGKGIEPDNSINESQKGFNTSFSLDLKYCFNDKYFIGLGNNYCIIYKSFGTRDFQPDNSDFIGIYRLYLNFGLKF